jgi:integrase
MPTIAKRKRQDGTIAYTAQVRIHKDNRVIYSTAKTFDSERLALQWGKRKETQLSKPGALDAVLHPSGTLDDAIKRYIESSRKQIGRTKEQVLAAVRRDEIAQMNCEDIQSKHIVAYADRLSQSRQPQTVNNYLSHLSAVFRLAHSAWGMPLDPAEMKKAMIALKSLGGITKSANRNRRPTLDEMDKLMSFFEQRSSRRSNILPMHRVCAFALFSTRRLEEIIRIRWADLEPGRILVRDMKHPGQKIGNDVWVDLPPEAEQIMRSMPKTDPAIFPYSTDAISAAFTRACQFLEIEDLHFHDLRHEGVSRLFEMGRTIPQVACVSGHRSWQSLQRYAHLRNAGDKWAGWSWLPKVVSQDQVNHP